MIDVDRITITILLTGGIRQTNVIMIMLYVSVLAMIHTNTGNTDITITDALITSENIDMIHVEYHAENHVIHDHYRYGANSYDEEFPQI